MIFDVNKLNSVHSMKLNVVKISFSIKRETLPNTRSSLKLPLHLQEGLLSSLLAFPIGEICPVTIVTAQLLLLGRLVFFLMSVVILDLIAAVFSLACIFIAKVGVLIFAVFSYRESQIVTCHASPKRKCKKIYFTSK